MWMSHPHSSPHRRYYDNLRSNKEKVYLQVRKLEFFVLGFFSWHASNTKRRIKEKKERFFYMYIIGPL